MEFSKPDPKPKIAETIPLSRTDAERKKLYGPLAEANKDLEGKIDFDKDLPTPDKKEPGPEPAPEPVPSVPAPDPRVVPSAEDKRAFLASILSGKAYEKTYTLFGELRITLRDRSPEVTEAMYTAVKAMYPHGAENSEGEYDLWLERLALAFQLCTLGKESFNPISDPEEAKKLVTVFMKKPKPLYMALIELVRIFEAHVDTLTANATNSDFWKPVAPGSQHAQPGPAPSTTGVSGAIAPSGTSAKN